jgi:hypothetical protein
VVLHDPHQAVNEFGVRWGVRGCYQLSGDNHAVTVIPT